MHLPHCSSNSSECHFQSLGLLSTTQHCHTAAPPEAQLLVQGQAQLEVQPLLAAVAAAAAACKATAVRYAGISPAAAVVATAAAAAVFVSTYTEGKIPQALELLVVEACELVAAVNQKEGGIARAKGMPAGSQQEQQQQ